MLFQNLEWLRICMFNCPTLPPTQALPLALLYIVKDIMLCSKIICKTLINLATIILDYAYELMWSCSLLQYTNWINFIFHYTISNKNALDKCLLSMFVLLTGKSILPAWELDAHFVRCRIWKQVIGLPDPKGSSNGHSSKCLWMQLNSTYSQSEHLCHLPKLLYHHFVKAKKCRLIPVKALLYSMCLPCAVKMWHQTKYTTSLGVCVCTLISINWLITMST